MSTLLDRRFMSKVNKTATCWNWTASKNSGGYGKYAIGTKAVRAHRFSYEAHNGTIKDGLVIDHTCHNIICVNPDHLRAVTQKQNSENRAGRNAGSASGHRGVTRHNGGWMARAKHNGKYVYGGTFPTADEAAVAATALRLELFTHNDKDREPA